jgi:hypothetical protein
VGTQIFFIGSQIANTWAHSASQIRKFVMLNPQIRKFPWFPSQQVANQQICMEKRSVFDPGPHCFASNIFFPK